MVADYLRLSGRYPDVDAGLVGDLISASVHAMWAPFSIPSQEDTGAYVDRVVGLLRAARAWAESASREDGAGSARPGSGDVDFRLLTMRDLHLGNGPWSDAAVARMERWLAVQRPELDHELLRELCLAAYIRHRRERLTPTQPSVLAWLGQAVPPATATVKRPQRALLGTRRAGRPEVFRAAYHKVGAESAAQPTQRAVADELGVSVRTLQSYLREWRISWADLP
jgi:hypothetical protein